MRRLALIALAASFASACAHSNDGYILPPDFRPIATESSAKARLYADCIAQAVETGAYGRAHNADTEMVLFTCTGAPARTFYEALGSWMQQGPWSAQIGGGRKLRSTMPIQRDLFGVDWCSTDEADDYLCVISLNAGEFLRP